MRDRNQQPSSDGGPANWGARLRRHRARPPARAIIVSVLLHALVVAGFWLAGIELSPEPEFVQYRVTLVSPPPQESGEPEPAAVPETPVVAEPEPEPPAPEPEPELEQPKQPEPKPAPPKPETATPTPEVNPDPAPVRGPDPKPVTIGGENRNVQLEGEEFPFPDYLENIVTQLHRMFRWSGSANLEAEVVFYIQRDGTAGGIRIVRRSGNFQFDLQAHEAVDRAGRTGAFGPLPDGWQQDRLWVSFTFEPPK